jgi:transposase
VPLTRGCCVADAAQHGRKNEVWGTKHEDDDGADCYIVCSACGHSWHGTAPEVHEDDTADVLEQARRKDLVARPEPESVHKRA